MQRRVVNAHTYPLFKAPQFAWRQSISLANDRYDIDTWGEAAHELNVHFSQPRRTMKKARGGICFDTYACPVGGMK